MKNVKKQGKKFITKNTFETDSPTLKGIGLRKLSSKLFRKLLSLNLSGS